MKFPNDTYNKSIPEKQWLLNNNNNNNDHHATGLCQNGNDDEQQQQQQEQYFHQYNYKWSGQSNQLTIKNLLEMLVPRRKGQLVKLLMLVPLSLLLLTTIYYQFYYERPVSLSIGRNQPRAAMLVAQSLNQDDQQRQAMESNLAFGRFRNRPMPVDSIDADYGDINSNSNSNNNSNSIIEEFQVTNNNHNRKWNNNNSAQKQSGDRTNDRYQLIHANNNNNNNQQQQQQQQHPQTRSRHQSSGGGSSSTAPGHRNIPHHNNHQHDDHKLAGVSNGLSNNNNNNNNGNDDSINSILDRDQSSSAESVKENEEANAQDAAVIPAPSEPNGPGELGRPVVLKNLTAEQQTLVDVGWENNAFNQYISDIISVNRTLPDVRDPSCKNLKYPPLRALPQTSVIICFHNEAWSVLLRTVHSVLNRSPGNLVKEIILVDDFSNKAYLGAQLEDYMQSLKIVKIVRASKREGLIRARLLGAKAASAPVLTFLDSHCECAEGWLEPLLTRIHEDPTAVVCPVIDVISDKTFEYHYKSDANSISVGGFDWNLQFNWHAIPEREQKRRKHPYEPIRSPTMAGGLFSIDKKFFEKLGTYDSGFDIWGGENLELSFKTWMCGGTLEVLPCSHVGHVFRSRSPYKWRRGVNVLRRNSVRLAEVWMDDYKRYYYDRIGHELGDYGDISERLELRNKLQCKPFSYFVKEIYPELFIPGEAIAYGEIRNEAPGVKMCIDSAARKTDFHKPLGVYPCHGAGGNQYWLLSRDGEIRRDEACVDYAGHDIVLFPCHGSGGNQQWLYESDTKQIRHSTSGRCMELARDRIRIQMSDCDPGNEAQKWTFQHYNGTLAEAALSSLTY